MKLLQSLRAATASLHEELHVHPALCRLTQNSVTRAYHQQALQKFHGFYLPLEHRYRGAAADLQRQFPAGDITRRLQNDLAHAGVDASALGTLDETTDAFTLEQALAYLYLREGSNLGGKVISKNLDSALSLRAGIENQFFWGHGADTGRNWQAFLQTLIELEDKVDIDATARYAAHLFQQLGWWLSQREHRHVPTAP